MPSSMKPKPRLIIFDFDGTLFDTQASIIHCITKTLDKMLKEQVSKSVGNQTKALITAGVGLQDTFVQLLQHIEERTAKDSAQGAPPQYPQDKLENLSVEYISDCMREYRRIYYEEGMTMAMPYEGVEALFESLKNEYGSPKHKTLTCKKDTDDAPGRRIPFVIVSNKGVSAIYQSLIDACLFHLTTGFVVGDMAGVRRKPDPQCWNEIIKPKLPSLDGEQVLVVGDTIEDLDFARNIGAKMCWAKYGYGSSGIALRRPDFVAGEISEVRDAIWGKQSETPETSPERE